MIEIKGYWDEVVECKKEGRGGQRRKRYTHSVKVAV